MHSNQPNSSDTKAPYNDFDMSFDATHLISGLPHSKGASLVKRLELKPTEQQRLSLGSFKGNNPPKGFSVEVTPDPDPAGSVLTEVTSMGTSEQYKLIMHITNYGVRTISAEVWRL